MTDNFRASNSSKLYEHTGNTEVNLSAPVHLQVLLLHMGPQGSEPSVVLFLSGLFSENLKFTRCYFLKVSSNGDFLDLADRLPMPS